MMKQLEDKSIHSAKRKFTISLIMLGLAVIYLISPVDLISGPPPFEWIEDIPMLIAAAAYSGYTYWKLKKEQEKLNAGS